MEPGVYQDLSFDDYARIPAINFSTLYRFKDTAAHARQGMVAQRESTPAQHLGFLVHMALLEPARFAESVVCPPKLDRRTTEGKRMWASFEAANFNKEIATAREMEVCLGLQSSVANHPTARQILYGDGMSELTIVWKDEELGTLCKGRIDRIGKLNTQPVVLDVKTVSAVASLRNWQRSITDHSYCEQAAMYLGGLQTLMPLQEGTRSFLWLVCEVDPPYLVRLFDADYDAIQYGDQQFRAHLEQYAKCMATGDWPGYPDGIETVGLPAWIQKTFDAAL